MPRTVPRFDFRVEFASGSDVGLVRKSNDDAVLCRPEQALFAVADGMGGHAAGGVAARLALQVASESLAAKETVSAVNGYAADPTLERRRALFARMRIAVEAANEAVLEGARTPGQEGMGTTLDLALLVRNRAFIAHVGDARAYLLRPTAVVQLTQDHSVAAPESVGNPFRGKSRGDSRLVNAVGMAGATVDTLFVDVKSGDRLILCTDGVHGTLEQESALQKLCARGDPAASVEAVIAHARAAGGHDNASAVVVDIGQRFVRRADDDGVTAADLTAAGLSPLLVDLPAPTVLAALAAGVEIELQKEAKLPRESASDLVAYILIDGIVQRADGRMLGPPALLFAESLVGIRRDGALPVVTSDEARLIRIRHDDFAEVCRHDPALGAALYMRVAKHLAATG